MTSGEIMQMAAEKALADNSWETIEFLFRPETQFELLLRLDFDGMCKKVADWFFDDSPGAMPHRHRSGPHAMMHRAIKVEEFYRKIVETRAA